MTIQSIYNFQANSIDGSLVSFAQYMGKILLIVNTASKCGFTSQFTGLEDLYQQYKDKNFYVLGFPCNQFGKQDPGSDSEIKTFCTKNYGVTFPMFAKINVNGKDAHPLFEFLKQQAPGILGSKTIKWNFTKFLVNSQGHVIKRFASRDTPQEIRPDIEKIIL